MAGRAYAIYINMPGLPVKHNANLYIPIINKTKHLINKTKHPINRTKHLINKTEHLTNKTKHLINKTEHLTNKTENLINKEEHPPHSSAVLRQHSRPGHSIHVPDEERRHQIFHI